MERERCILLNRADAADKTHRTHTSPPYHGFSILEKKHYEELQAICNLGLTHLSLEILKYRDLFEKNFATLYSITKNELAIRMEDEQFMIVSSATG